MIAGQSGTIKFQVSDKDGKPVANEDVTITWSADSEPKNDDYTYLINGEDRVTVVKTDANGIARVVLAPKKNCKNDTEVAVASYKLSAACASKEDVSTKLSFRVGAISYSAEDYINSSVKELTEDANIKAGDNADKDAHSATTTNMVPKNQDYVSSQQVSSKGGEEHAVTFSSGVCITIPATEGEDELAEKYVQPVDKKSGEYPTYADISESIDFDIKDFSNVEYATVYFNSIKLSKYSRMYIYPYYYKNGEKKEDKNFRLDTTPAGDAQVYGGNDGHYTTSNKGLQIKKADLVCGLSDTNYYEGITIKIESVGQVNADNNAGFDVKDITYVYNSNTKTATVTKLLPSASINWDTVTPVYSTESKVTREVEGKISNYDDIKTEGVDHVTYTLPVFPFVGNAIITAYDELNNPLKHYAVPTVNDPVLYDSVKKLTNIDDNSVTTGAIAGYQNKNVIGKYGYRVDNNGKVIENQAYLAPVKAYLITTDEATASVGKLTQDGNNVIVNSEESGTTFLMGELSCTDENIKLDAKNKEVYTYVMWNPIPNVSDNNGFLALEGQNVKVTAQLYDKNGNKATEKNVGIEFSDRSGQLKTGSEYGNNYNDKDDNGGNIYTDEDSKKGRATVVNISNNSLTDANGQVELILQGTGAVDLLGISAKSTSSKYDVAVVLNDTSVTTADIYWLVAGLSYQARLDKVTVAKGGQLTANATYFTTSGNAVYEKYLNLTGPYVSTIEQVPAVVSMGAVTTGAIATTTNAAFAGGKEEPYYEAANGVSKVEAEYQHYNPKEKWNIATKIEVYGLLKAGAFKEFHLGVQSGAVIGAKSGKAFHGTVNTDTGVNGMVSVYSDVADSGEIDFTLGENSFKDVEFYHMNKDWENWDTCKSVGYGKTTVNEQLTVPFSVGTVGTMLTSFAPMGTKVIGRGTTTGAIATSASVTAYVKVTDTFGNPIHDRDVKFTITGASGAAISGTSLTAATAGAVAVTGSSAKCTEVRIPASWINADGIAAVTITTPTAGEVNLRAAVLEKDTVSGPALVDKKEDPTISPATETYQFTFKDATSEPFAILADSISYSEKTIEFSMTKNIVPDSVVPEIFKITHTPVSGGAASFEKSIDKIAVDGKKITITLKSPIYNISDNSELQVTIEPSAREKTSGVTYKMTATDGDNEMQGVASDSATVTKAGIGFKYTIANGVTDAVKQ